MSLVAEAFHPAPRVEDISYPPTHDFWYAKDPGGYIVETGGAGFAISADTIMRHGPGRGPVPRRFLGNVSALHVHQDA